VDYPNLWGYARELYATPGFGDTTDFDAIKRHYYTSARLSPDNKKEDIIIPKGPDLSGWNEPAEREHVSESKEKWLIYSETQSIFVIFFTNWLSSFVIRQP